jgi:hypothetical protein
MERYLSVMALLLLSVYLGFPGHAQAVSYPLLEEQREEKAAKGIREKGETVCLFQSGTEDIRKTIGVGDILIAYREGGKSGHEEVGKIRVLLYVGEDYIKGEVLEGRVQAGDVAKKGAVAGLVILTGERCK